MKGLYTPQAECTDANQKCLPSMDEDSEDNARMIYVFMRFIPHPLGRMMTW